MIGPTEDAIPAAWRALRSSDDGSGWRLIPISSAGAAIVAAAMLFPDRREALIVTFPGLAMPAAPALPSATGFDCLPVSLESDRQHRVPDSIALVRMEGAERAMFELMALDLAAQCYQNSGLPLRTLMTTFLSRVREWQDFMWAGTRSPLSLQRQTGLFGELLLIEALLDEITPRRHVLSAWVGPLRAAQDFRFEGHAIEVKTFVGTTGFPAQISGLDQLDNPDGSLHLVAYRLEVSGSGRSLPQLVTALRTRILGPAVTAFNARLTCAGWNDAHAPAYPRLLSVTEIDILPVGTGFPRLIRTEVPPALMSARYVLDLDMIDVPRIGLNELVVVIRGNVGWT